MKWSHRHSLWGCMLYEIYNIGSSLWAQRLMNPTSILEDAGLIPGPTQWVKDLALLWLWYRLAAIDPIWPLAWELSYAVGAALKSKQARKKDDHNDYCQWLLYRMYTQEATVASNYKIFPDRDCENCWLWGWKKFLSKQSAIIWSCFFQEMPLLTPIHLPLLSVDFIKQIEKQNKPKKKKSKRKEKPPIIEVSLKRGMQCESF